jgi:tripartite-type tricarboxylate transporter receptor subunit TctC
MTARRTTWFMEQFQQQEESTAMAIHSLIRTAAHALAAVTAAALLALLSLPGSAAAQGWPAKPVRVVVPYPPGGGVDVVARLVAAYLPEGLKQPVIVENRSGAFGNIAAEHVAKSDPDGYTWLINTVGQAITPSTYRHLPFDPVEDFQPVTQISRTTLVLIVPATLSVKNVKELVALAKSQPGELNYGSTGLTNPLHLAMELFKLTTGTDIVAVPFKGDGPIYAAILSGQVQMAVMPLASAAAHLKAGKLRVLAVTNAERSAALPDMPTIAETYPGVQVTSWQALFAPAKTPREIVSRMQREVASVLKMPQMRDKFRGFGAEPVGNTPEEFERMFKEDVARFAKIIKAANIPPQD